MSNDRRFFVKLLGLFMIEIANVTPEKIGKLLWQLVFMIAFLKVIWIVGDIIVRLF